MEAMNYSPNCFSCTKCKQGQELHCNSFNLFIYLLLLFFQHITPVCKTLFFFIQPANGLLYAQYCSATKKTKCGCQPGMYCIMGFNDPYCRECRKYKQCGAGLGVSVPGTAPAIFHLSLFVCLPYM